MAEEAMQYGVWRVIKFAYADGHCYSNFKKTPYPVHTLVPVLATCQSSDAHRNAGGISMWWDFLLFITLGPLIACIIYFLSDHKKRSAEHVDQLRENSHLVC